MLSRTNMKKMTIPKATYHDTPHPEEVFYMFYIGRYNTRHHFTVGITHDIHVAEFSHAKTFPVANIVYQAPIENNHAAIHKFMDSLPKSQSPLGPEQPEPFGASVPYHFITTDVYSDIDPYVSQADMLLMVQERER